MATLAERRLTLHSAPDDVRAARIVLGADGETHDNVRDLPGSAACPHLMTGSGQALDRVLADTRSEETRQKLTLQWAARPYRHHLYTGDTGDTQGYCRCGNGAGNPLHGPCVIVLMEYIYEEETCDDCGLTGGLHNEAVDH